MKNPIKIPRLIKIKSPDRFFAEWIVKKDALHSIGSNPFINEGEIWWCAIGENIGTEINGKNAMFSRPVIVFKKLNPRSFMAIPLTSQYHTGSWYVFFRLKNKAEYAALAQSRVMSTARLYGRIGQMSARDFQKVRTGFHKLYCE